MQRRRTMDDRRRTTPSKRQWSVVRRPLSAWLQNNDQYYNGQCQQQKHGYISYRLTVYFLSNLHFDHAWVQR